MELIYHTDSLDLRIRNATQADAARLAAWWNDGRVMAHAGFPHGLGTTPEEVARKLQEDREETGRRLILEESGRPIGEMCYRMMGQGKAEIGIKICEQDRQEHGLGRIFLSMLLKALFARGIETVVLDTWRIAAPSTSMSCWASPGWASGGTAGATRWGSCAPRWTMPSGLTSWWTTPGNSRSAAHKKTVGTHGPCRFFILRPGGLRRP